jgi:hypothetical protein
MQMLLLLITLPWMAVAFIGPTSTATSTSISTSTSTSITSRLYLSQSLQSDIELLPIRIGHGFDIHRMAPLQDAGQPIVIGGVVIDHIDQKVCRHKYS